MCRDAPTCGGWFRSVRATRLPPGECGRLFRRLSSARTSFPEMTMIPRMLRARATTASSLVLVLGIASCGGGGSDPAPVVASVEVTPNSATKQVGETQQLSAAVKDATGNLLSGLSVSWSSSATNIASVSASGLVTANALGSATITATSGGKSGVSNITVSPPPIASITVAPANDTLLVGENVQLNVTLRDAQNNVVTGRTISYVSTATTVASVSNSGLVTGVGDGVATITASADGKSAVSSIRVFGPCSTALAQVITVGQTVNGTLATTDCLLTDGTYADGYFLTVGTATNVQIDMTASYDTYLILLELVPSGLVQRSFNDDVDPDDPNDPNDTFNTNSRIVFNLVAGGQYFILANSFDANITGDYQLKVATATPFVAGAAMSSKSGKAPIETLMKALRPVVRPR